MCSYVRTCVINGKLYSAYRRVITRKTVRELTGNYSAGWKTTNSRLTTVRDERFFFSTTSRAARWITQPLVQSWRTSGTRDQNGKRKAFLGTQHSLLYKHFYFFCPTNVSLLWRIYVYIHKSYCVQTVYELPLLPNNTAVKHFYTNQ